MPTTRVAILEFIKTEVNKLENNTDINDDEKRGRYSSFYDLIEQELIKNLSGDEQIEAKRFNATLYNLINN